MADRTRRFVGRRDLLDRMHGFCDGDENPSLLVITGEPGCGKSAVMARFAEEALHRHPNWLILGHFVGASPASTSLRQMLRRLCTHLNRATGVNEDAPEDIKELLKLFPELLTKASEQRNLLIIIDAVNQLEQSDHAHSIHWLPQMLPKNVRLVISTLAGEAHDVMLQRRIKPQEKTVTGLTAPEIQSASLDSQEAPCSWPSFWLSAMPGVVRGRRIGARRRDSMPSLRRERPAQSVYHQCRLAPHRRSLESDGE